MTLQAYVESESQLERQLSSFDPVNRPCEFLQWTLTDDEHTGSISAVIFVLISPGREGGCGETGVEN